MYLINQEIAKKIAQIGRIEPHDIRDIFSAKTEERAEALEMKIRENIMVKTGRSQVARAIAVYSPLLFANEQISLYIHMTGNQWLRSVAPEILSVDELVYLTLGDLMLTEHEVELFVSELHILQELVSRSYAGSDEVDIPDIPPKKARKTERKITDKKVQEEIDKDLEKLFRLLKAKH